ncbi:MAG TPA: molybdate ABC transporter substrate-binding protein [Halanaerobiales bacterium]|nr:molybdate ABC transporter substrate-binding protein [Halanaerobiales bacterium]
MKNKLLISVLIILSLSLITTNTYADEKLLIYSAAGLIKPMEEITDNFQKEYGIDMHLQFNGSGVLKNQIETLKKGDIYIAADNWYLSDLYKKSIIKSYHNIAEHTPVIIVPESNPGNINKFKDLLKPDKKLIVADPSAAIGKTTEEIFQKNNIKSEIEHNIISKAETVNKVRMYIIMNQAQAGIVWKANYHESKEKLRLVDIPKEKNVIKKISIGKLKFSDNKELAEKFINFVLSEKSRKIFENWGYNIKIEQVKP